MYIKEVGGGEKMDRLLKSRGETETKAIWRTGWKMCLISSAHPSPLLQLQALEKADADLPSRPSLPAAWRCLRLRNALSPETIFFKWQGSTSIAAQLWEFRGLRKILPPGIARAACPRRVSWSHLCGLTGQLDMLQTPQGGDWALRSMMVETGSVFSPLYAQGLLPWYQCLINTCTIEWRNEWVNPRKANNQ